MDFYKLRIKDIKKETDEAVTVAFDVPEELSETFRYTHGQYITLKVPINGTEERRAYSMCSSPSWKEPIQVTVKKVKKGKVSSYVNEKLEVGDEIEVMAPEGRFFTEVDAQHKKDYYLFAAGSGITPIMSILKTVIEEEPKSQVFLLYGNRNEDSIIFNDLLAELEQKYEGQLKVVHTLSQPKKERLGGLASFIKKPVISWSGNTGRIDKKMVKTFIEKNPGGSDEKEYFICGPGGMIQTVEKTLKDINVNPDNIHVEYFSSEDLPHEKVASGDVSASKVKVHLDGEAIEVEVPKGETILDVLIANKYDPPYSCTSGSCSTCMAKTISGKVRMEVCLALDDDEVEEGYILTCQSHPQTEEVEITYDV